MKLNRLRRDDKGASALEFALAAPAMMMFIIGIGQLGMLCMADAGLGTAVAEGARVAAVYPTPSDETILARIDEAAWGMQADRMGEPEITRDEDADENAFVEISMTYSAPLDFIFLDLGPVTLTEVRRVYLQGEPEGGGASSTSTSSTSTSSTSTSSTSTSAGGSSSDGSSTSSTSTGSTTSGGSTTSSTGSTSTSSGSSNGNSNGNGHGHGNGNGP